MTPEDQAIGFIDGIWAWLAFESPDWLLSLDASISWTGFSALAGFCLTALGFLAGRIDLLPSEPEPVALRLRRRRLLRLQSQSAGQYLLYAFVAFVTGLVLGVAVDPAVPATEAAMQWQSGADVIPQVACLVFGIVLVSRALFQIKALLGLSPDEEVELGRLPSSIKDDEARLKELEAIPVEDRTPGVRDQIARLRAAS